jgi:two-component system chemotaxis response regulator CheB
VAEAERRDIVVVGASAGGVTALQKVAAGIPAGFEGSVCMVLHLLPRSESLLPGLITRAGARTAVHPADQARLAPGSVYIAPPDRHLEMQDGVVRITKGPKENCHRPSIDVLFRSAAHAHGRRVIGALLTGADDDGAAGLKQIRDCGGITIVQDPAEAEFPEMPTSAIRLFEPHHTLPVAKIGALIGRLAAEELKAPTVVCDPSAEPEKQRGHPSTFICPDCGGVMWELEEEGLLRYRCRVGHAHSAGSMADATAANVERSLWAAVRALEESAELSRRVGRRTAVLRADMERKAAEREAHARHLRRILENGGSPS